MEKGNNLLENNNLKSYLKELEVDINSKVEVVEFDKIKLFLINRNLLVTGEDDKYEVEMYCYSKEYDQIAKKLFFKRFLVEVEANNYYNQLYNRIHSLSEKEIMDWIREYVNMRKK